MIIEQLMPSLSPTMEEGVIAAWKVKKGDKVRSGQVIAEIQTDKTVVDWESLDAGTIAEILIPAGEKARVNMVVALIATKDDDDVAAAVTKAKESNKSLSNAGSGAVDAKPAKKPKETPPKPAAPDESEPAPAEKPFLSTTSPLETAAVKQQAPAESPQPVRGLRVSPVAARIAAQHGVDLKSLRGSGPDGRIVRADVEAASKSSAAGVTPGASGGKSAAKAVANPFLPSGGNAVESLPLSPMRQVIGQRLLQSKTTIPHFYVSDRIDARALVALRAQLNAIEGVKVTVNDLVVKAVALTLRRHPEVNATFDGSTIRRHRSADISIAVAIPDGLITPILTAAESLTISEIGVRVRDLATRAVAGKLKPTEYTGGTFTISNLGMFGIESFGAIINPPQAAILAVAGIRDEPVVDGDRVVPGKTLALTLSADHRVVDGAAAAAFLRDLRQLLESPAALML